MSQRESSTRESDWVVSDDNAARRATPPRELMTGWAGWVVFAAIMMIVLGSITVIDGLVALLNHDWYAVRQSDLLIWNFTAWGWVWLIGGAVTVLAGLGVLTGQIWARAVGVLLAGLNLLAQLVFISAYPVWSVLIIAIDVVVIYALTAHGRELAA